MTTSVTINFLRKPEPADLIGKAKLMKLGKQLAVGEVALYSEGESDMVADAIGTVPSRSAATTARHLDTAPSLSCPRTRASRCRRGRRRL